MKFVRTNRPKIPFCEVVSRDVFYSEYLEDYGMRIAEKDVTSHSNAVLLTDGDLVYIPNDMKVEIVNGEFVER